MNKQTVLAVAIAAVLIVVTNSIMLFSVITVNEYWKIDKAVNPPQGAYQYYHSLATKYSDSSFITQNYGVQIYVGDDTDVVWSEVDYGLQARLGAGVQNTELYKEDDSAFYVKVSRWKTTRDKPEEWPESEPVETEVEVEATESIPGSEDLPYLDLPPDKRNKVIVTLAVSTSIVIIAFFVLKRKGNL